MLAQYWPNPGPILTITSAPARLTGGLAQRHASPTVPGQSASRLHNPLLGTRALQQGVLPGAAMPCRRRRGAPRSPRPSRVKNTGSRNFAQRRTWEEQWHGICRNLRCTPWSMIGKARSPQATAGRAPTAQPSLAVSHLWLILWPVLWPRSLAPVSGPGLWPGLWPGLSGRKEGCHGNQNA
jgi:hypothetical protein